MTIVVTVLVSTLPVNAREAPSAAVQSSSTAASRSRLPLAGVQYRGNWGYSEAERKELLDKLDASGVQWLRIGVPWSALQTSRPTSSRSGFASGAVARADRIINEAHARGFRILVTLLSTPRWANGGRADTVLPTDPRAYARAAGWLAARWRGKVSSWQIYNEPNLAEKLVATPAQYVRLLCAAYPAIHKAVPDSNVVMGGTAGNDWQWVQRAYAAGAKGCFDVLATHPYQGKSLSPSYRAPNDKQWWFSNISLVRNVMLKNRDEATPVWFTEIGWSTHQGTVRKPGVTLSQQADYLEQMFHIVADRYPFVKRVSWYMARDESHSDAHHNNFGLYYRNLDPKPAAVRLRQLLRGA